MLAVTLSGSIWRAARPSRRPMKASDEERRERHDGRATRLKDAAAARLSSHVRIAGRRRSGEDARDTIARSASDEFQ